MTAAEFPGPDGPKSSVSYRTPPTACCGHPVTGLGRLVKQPLNCEELYTTAPSWLDPHELLAFAR